MPSLSQPLPPRCASCLARDECPFFPIARPLLFQVQAAVEVHWCTTRYSIFHQGREAAGFYILRSGWVKLSHRTKNGKKPVTGIAGPGSVLGLFEVLTSMPFESTAEALEDCELEFVRAATFMALLEKNPNLAVDLLKTTGLQAQRSRADLYALAGGLPSANRLLAILGDLAANCGSPSLDGIRLRIPFRVQDLAEKIGCSRQWTSKLLRELETKKLIQREAGWIIIRAHDTEQTKLRLAKGA